MRRGTLLLAALGTMAVAACGPAQAVITAELEVENPEGEGTVLRPMTDLEVQLLPYDRDPVFDSLARAAATPEPQIPAELLEAQQRVATAQAQWRTAENQWATLRDELQGINDELQGLNRGEARYRVLFNEFRDKEARLNQVERQMRTAFSRFDSLQQATASQIQAVKLQRQEWGDEAFADYSTVVALKLREIGRDPQVDTTDAQGRVVFDAPPGEWWVYARQEQPFDELYWNVPIVLTRGEPVTLMLNRQNAVVRPNF